MESLPSLLVFAIIAAFTPGPNNIMIMTSGLNFGARASMPHLMGICLGFPTMFLAIGFGLGFLFERFTLLHAFIQVFGVLYLLYLSWLIAISGRAKAQDGQSRPLTFVQAALFQWVNPKAWVTGTSAIAAFTTIDADLTLQILIIGLVLFLVALPSAAVWMLFGTALQRILANPRHLRVFNVTMALLLAGSVMPVVVDLVQKYI